MKRTIAIAAGLFLLAALSPSNSAISVHLPAPDPGRGLLGVSVGFHLHGTMRGGIADTVYFVRAEHADGKFGVDDVIESNFGKAGNVYVLNAEPGRYVAIGIEYFNAGMPTRGVVVFSKSDVLRTEVTVRAGSVTFMGEIKVEGSMKQRELDPVQANSMNFLLAHSKKLGMDRVLNPDFAYPGVIKSIERGEAVDSGFWYSARLNHFKNETAWQSLIMARPVLPVEGAPKPVPSK